MGGRRGLRRLQLQRAIQLADLRVRAETKRVPIALARIERSALRDAATRPHESAAADAEAVEEALSKTGIRP